MLYLYLIKTLKTVLIGLNNIGDQGAKYLAEALLFNEVRQNVNSFINYSVLPFIVDTYNSGTYTQSNW
jgi:hypothetical protein